MAEYDFALDRLFFVFQSVLVPCSRSNFHFKEQFNEISVFELPICPIAQERNFES